MTPAPPVALETPRQLYEHGYQIGAYCSPCRRWKTLELLDFVRVGQEDVPLPQLSLECSRCGEKGSMQIRPPHPEIEPYGPE
jgi:hypothetical protein